MSLVRVEIICSPGVPSALLNVSLAPLFPWNHWGHKMLPHLARALGADASAEFRANRSHAPALGFLLEGAYSSNPCAGSACMLNPLYEFYPRDRWIVQSDMCQRADDFVRDAATGTSCCAAPN